MSQFHRVQRSYTLTVNNSTSTASTHAPNLGSQYLRLVSNVDTWFALDTPAADGACVFLPARFPMHIRVTPGSVVNAIADSASTGSFNITEMST